MTDGPLLSIGWTAQSLATLALFQRASAQIAELDDCAAAAS
jgi:hypothetical protein